MARLQKIEGPVNSTAEAAIAVLGQAILLGSLNQAGCQLSDVFSAAVREVLRVLPSVVVSVMQVLPCCAGGHDLLLEALLKIPVSFWTLISALAGAA